MKVGQVKNEGKGVLSKGNNMSKILEAQNRKVAVGDYNLELMKWEMQGQEC